MLRFLLQDYLGEFMISTLATKPVSTSDVRPCLYQGTNGAGHRADGGEGFREAPHLFKRIWVRWQRGVKNDHRGTGFREAPPSLRGYEWGGRGESKIITEQLTAKELDGKGHRKERETSFANSPFQIRCGKELSCARHMARHWST